MRRLLLAAVVAACGLLWTGGVAGAATGDVVARLQLTQCPPSYAIPHFFTGVGIAFDGTSLWYSCAGAVPDLFRADPATGAVEASYNIDGGLGALAYDATRNAIWAAPGVGSTQEAIQLIQLDARQQVSGSRVAFSAPGGQLGVGLAYDATDDSLYVGPFDDLRAILPSPPVTIAHYTTGGALLGSSPSISNGCYTSGLALGGDLLYEASVLYIEPSRCSSISAAQKADPSTPALSFASPGSLIAADLECDPDTFRPTDVLWEASTYEIRRTVALEVPKGSCGLGGEPDTAQHGRVTGEVSTRSETGARVSGSLELHCTPADGRNRLRVRWGRNHVFDLAQLGSAVCTDARAITPNPAPTGFDTFRGAGTGTYDHAAGAHAEWTVADGGRSHHRDMMTLTVQDPSGAVVLTIDGPIGDGEVRARAR
jgi:hypothetical protein